MLKRSVIIFSLSCCFFSLSALATDEARPDNISDSVRNKDLGDILALFGACGQRTNIDPNLLLEIRMLRIKFKDLGDTRISREDFRVFIDIINKMTQSHPQLAQLINEKLVIEHSNDEVVAVYLNVSLFEEQLSYLLHPNEMHKNPQLMFFFLVISILCS